MDFRLARPELLQLLALVPFLLLFFWWDWYRRSSLLRRFAQGDLLDRLQPGRSAVRRLAKLGLLTFAVIALTGALVRPQFGFQERQETASGVDLFVVFDISRSMLSATETSDEWWGGGSRLKVAKDQVRNLVRRLGGDRVGLIPFSAEAFIYCPLTLDHRIALDFLEEIDIDLVGAQGTDIGNALQLALDAFARVETNADQAIVLITDGEDHGGYALEAAEKAAARGIRIFSLGLGSEIGAPIPLPGGGFLKDNEGTIVQSRLDMDLLRRIAEITGGTAYHAEGSGLIEIESIYNDLQRLQQAEREERVFRVANEQFTWFLLAAVCLLVVEWLLPERGSQRKEWRGRFQ